MTEPVSIPRAEIPFNSIANGLGRVATEDIYGVKLKTVDVRS